MSGLNGEVVDKVEWVATLSPFGGQPSYAFQRKETYAAPNFGETWWNIGWVNSDGFITVEKGEHVTKEDLVKFVEWISERYLQPLRRI